MLNILGNYSLILLGIRIRYNGGYIRVLQMLSYSEETILVSISEAESKEVNVLHITN